MNRNKTVENTVKKNSIDLTIKVKRLNDLRAEKLLRLFSEHFISMAVTSNKYGAHPQAMWYLHYAGNLLNILLDENMKCPSVVESDVEDIQEAIQQEIRNTRHGLNNMLNFSHKMTDTFELKMAHGPPNPNWAFKKPQDEPTKSVKQSTYDKKPLRPSQMPQENPVKGIKTFHGMKEKDKNLGKSLPNLPDKPVLKSAMKSQSQEDDNKIIRFEVFSDDEDESTDL